MLRISILLVCALIWACESSSGSPADEPAGGQGSGATAGLGDSNEAGADAVGGSDNQAAAGSVATGAVAGEATGGSASGGASPQGEAGEPSTMGGMPNSSGDRVVSELDDCKYAADQCTDKPAKPHYWECDKDPGVAPAEGCELANVNAVSAWCCPDPFCSAYPGAASLCEGLYPEQPNSLICAMGTPGLGDCQQPNPISLQQVYCCP